MGLDMKMSDFLPRDPNKALVEIKELLYARLNDLVENVAISKKKLTTYDDYQSGQFDAQENCWDEEIEFLRNLLDRIERS